MCHFVVHVLSYKLIFFLICLLAFPLSNLGKLNIAHNTMMHALFFTRKKNFFISRKDVQSYNDDRYHGYIMVSMYSNNSQRRI